MQVDTPLLQVKSPLDSRTPPFTENYGLFWQPQESAVLAVSGARAVTNSATVQQLRGHCVESFLQLRRVSKINCTRSFAALQGSCQELALSFEACEFS